MSGLVLHCGAHKATWQDVMNSRAKEPKSDTYVPIEHGEFVNTVIEALDHHGYEIKSEAHALMKRGQRYFGYFDVAHRDLPNDPEHARTIGLRNGHDGQMPAALAGGLHTFVCDNLCFSGDMVKVQRRHTRFIHRDIMNVISRGIADLSETFAEHDERIDFYKDKQIADSSFFNDILITAIRHRAALPTQLPKIIREWDRSVNGEGPGGHESLAGNSYYSLMNCFTEVEKLNPSPQQAPKRNRLMTRLLDQFSGFARHQYQNQLETTNV